MNVTPAKPEEAFELVLREEDSKEVSPAWRERLALTILASPSLAFRDTEGRLVALGGVTETATELGPWLLCSPLVEQHRATAWRYARRAVRSCRERAAGRLIYNFVPKDSPRNRAFLRRLGFRILPSPREGFDFFYLPHV